MLSLGDFRSPAAASFHCRRIWDAAYRVTNPAGYHIINFYTYTFGFDLLNRNSTTFVLENPKINLLG